jgi:hypothetical protein
MHLLDLPFELLLHILVEVDVKTLLRFSCCCKNVHSLTNDNLLWKYLVERDFKECVEFPPQNFTKETWIETISNRFKLFYSKFYQFVNLSGQWKAIYGKT